MNQVHDIERRITDWFQADATSAGSDRVLASALSRVASAPQDRSAWMVTGMQAHGRIEASRSGRVALMAGAFILLIGLVVNVLPSLPRRDGAASEPSLAPSPTPETIAPWPFEMPPGTYGGIVDSIPFTFSVPGNGWSSGLAAGSLYLRGDPIRGWLRFWTPAQVYADPCEHTLAKAVGPSTADLAAAMASIPGMGGTVTDITVGGFPAKHVSLKATSESGCVPHETYLWRDEGVEDDSIRRPRLADSWIDVWLVEVDGRRLVIDSDVGSDYEAAGFIREIVASLEIKPVSATVLSFVHEVATVCARAGALMASDRAIDRGFREEPPQFATLGAAVAHADAAAPILDEAAIGLRRLAPPDVMRPAVQKALGMIGATVEALRAAALAARAGDEATTGARLVDAYLATNRVVAALGTPSEISLLEPSLAGCRLPPGPG